MIPVSTEATTITSLLENIVNTTLLPSTGEAGITSSSSSFPSKLPHTFQETMDYQNDVVRSSHALGFWIIGVVFSALTISTLLIMCRKPVEEGQRRSRRGSTLSDVLKPVPSAFSVCNQSSLGLHCEDFTHCPSCRKAKADKFQIHVQRSHSLSSIPSYMDEFPPPYRPPSPEDLKQHPIEARNPVLETIIQLPGVTIDSEPPSVQCLNPGRNTPTEYDI